jgi:hypothetical protein
MIPTLSPLPPSPQRSQRRRLLQIRLRSRGDLPPEDPTDAVVSNLTINGYGFWVA